MPRSSKILQRSLQLSGQGAAFQGHFKTNVFRSFWGSGKKGQKVLFAMYGWDAISLVQRMYVARMPKVGSERTFKPAP